MAVTIKDLARRLNVSTSVVSTVLNGKKYCGVSDELRKKVLAMAEELKCCPNANARALRCGRSDLIGIMMPVPMIRWYSKLVTYFQQKLQKMGKTALFFFWNIEYSREEQRAAYNRMIGYGVDGIILWDDFGFRDTSTPTVVYWEDGRYAKDCDIVEVVCQDVMEKALKLIPPEQKFGVVCHQDDSKFDTLFNSPLCDKSMIIHCCGGEENAGVKVWQRFSSTSSDVRTIFFANVENLLSFSLELFRHSPDKIQDYTFVNFEGFTDALPDWLNVISLKPHWQELADVLLEVIMERIKNPDALPIHKKIYPVLNI